METAGNVKVSPELSGAGRPINTRDSEAPKTTISEVPGPIVAVPATDEGGGTVYFPVPSGNPGYKAVLRAKEIADLARNTNAEVSSTTYGEQKGLTPQRPTSSQTNKLYTNADMAVFACSFDKKAQHVNKSQIIFEPPAAAAVSPDTFANNGASFATRSRLLFAARHSPSHLSFLPNSPYSISRYGCKNFVCRPSQGHSRQCESEPTAQRCRLANNHARHRGTKNNGIGSARAWGVSYRIRSEI